jgi:hypothetical protein
MFEYIRSVQKEESGGERRRRGFNFGGAAFYNKNLFKTIYPT